MKPKLIKTLSTAGLVAALLAVGGSALATNISVRYNVVMPGFQVGVTTPPDVKTYYKRPGHIWVDSVGSSYKANAVMCSLGGAYCGGGTKVHDFTDGSSGDLPNEYAADAKLYVQLTTSSFTATSVRVSGDWIAE